MRLEYAQNCHNDSETENSENDAQQCSAYDSMRKAAKDDDRVAKRYPENLTNKKQRKIYVLISNLIQRQPTEHTCDKTMRSCQMSRHHEKVESAQVPNIIPLKAILISWNYLGTHELTIKNIWNAVCCKWWWSTGIDRIVCDSDKYLNTSIIEFTHHHVMLCFGRRKWRSGGCFHFKSINHTKMKDMLMDNVVIDVSTDQHPVHKRRRVACVV